MSAPTEIHGEPMDRPTPGRATRKPRQRGSGGTGHGNGPSSTASTGLRLVGYVRVSTAAQATDRSHGLNAQWDALDRWCRANGHELVTVVPEVASTRDPERMYGRLAVEALLRAGLADAMAVRDLDRASRGTLDGAEMLSRAVRHGWRVVGTDGLDSSDPEQELMINIRLAVAQEERRKIARRTREGLAAARSKGAVLGRPRTIPDAVVRRMKKLRTEGLSCARIAAALDRGKTPPPSGGANWSPATVRTVLRREGAL
ncbi:DNA invertase Pin-like site-specific DNA recombinase [Actinomycetospora cinnamomea]|uniref:DNA invertase Pin-like site-specific DNA recombinase n=2 Tax=Actinomycetospora cinnamomea TaxID=663609 RepID=A0A2U1FD69_9PSEU|nr:DNA invertase Pin-like site-specific DNA recombinase [Actinomycetospora cinnamomea]